jgi:hypothetical protein
MTGLICPRILGRARARGLLGDDDDGDRGVAGEADGGRAQHAVQGLGRAADHDRDRVVGVGLVQVLGRGEELVGDQALAALELPALLAVAQPVGGGGAQVALDVVERDLLLAPASADIMSTPGMCAT